MTTARSSQKKALPSKSSGVKSASSKIKKKPNKPRPVCKTCGNSFSKPANLKAHERIHTGEKRYGCHICSKRFVWKSSLNFHSRTAHKELEPAPSISVNEDSDLTSSVPTTVSSNTPLTSLNGAENAQTAPPSLESSGCTSRDFSETADPRDSPLNMTLKSEPELLPIRTNEWLAESNIDFEFPFENTEVIPLVPDPHVRMDEQYAPNRSQKEFEVDTYISSPLLPFSSLVTPLEDFHLI